MNLYEALKSNRAAFAALMKGAGGVRRQAAAALAPVSAMEHWRDREEPAAKGEETPWPSPTAYSLARPFQEGFPQEPTERGAASAAAVQSRWEAEGEARDPSGNLLEELERALEREARLRPQPQGEEE